MLLKTPRFRVVEGCLAHLKIPLSPMAKVSGFLQGIPVFIIQPYDERGCTSQKSRRRL